MPARRLLSALFSTALVTCSSLAALAGEDDRLAFGAGVYDINDDKTAGDFRLEYRWADPLVWSIYPFAGAMVTADAALYGFVGAGIEVPLGERISLTPNLAAGLYSDGSGKDLGHAVEFRSGAEIAYRFDDNSRIGLAFHHISNASLDDTNPGTETVVLSYSVPVSRLFGR